MAHIGLEDDRTGCETFKIAVADFAQSERRNDDFCRRHFIEISVQRQLALMMHDAPIAKRTDGALDVLTMECNDRLRSVKRQPRTHIDRTHIQVRRYQPHIV